MITQDRDAWVRCSRIVSRRLLFQRARPLRGQRPSKDWTLSQFFYAWVLPQRVYPHNPSRDTLGEKARSIDLWCAATGDPSLEAIATDPSYVERFAALLHTRISGREPAGPSVDSLRKHTIQVNWLFALAGPPEGSPSPLDYLFGYRCVAVSDGPHRGQRWERRPRPALPMPDRQRREAKPPLAAEQFERLLAACRKAVSPLIAGIDPAQFWVAFYTFNRLVGTRFTQQFDLTWSMLDGQYLSCPASIEKGKKPRTYYVHRRALEAIWKIRIKGPRIFPHPYCERTRFRDQCRLFEAAEIPVIRSHGNRRWLATTLAEQGHGLASKQQLGHQDQATTDAHYIRTGSGLEHAFAAIDADISASESVQLRLF